MPNLVAEFVDVSKSYRRSLSLRPELVALNGVSFGIESGEVFALLGPNRAGKTTLLKILLGLCHPGGGRVMRLGRPLSEQSTLARVGYMHESQAFPRYLTSIQLLEFYGKLSGISPSNLRNRVPALLDRVGLADRAHEPIARFSKGMVQRLALAHSVLAEPDLLVLDEPTEGLDLNARAPASGNRRRAAQRRQDRAPRFACSRRSGSSLRSTGRAGRGTARLYRFA